MKLKKVNSYRCPHCEDIQERQSEKQWIKSFCTKTDKVTRLMLIKTK